MKTDRDPEVKLYILQSAVQLYAERDKAESRTQKEATWDRYTAKFEIIYRYVSSWSNPSHILP